MRIGEIKQALANAVTGGNEAAPPAQESRALIALTPPAPIAAAPRNYNRSPFLAQLLATKEQHAQTRDKRRAEPGEAIAAYRATASRV